MTGDVPDIHTLSGAYALDVLDGDEAVAFERHLESCAPCRDEVRSLRETLPALADACAEPAPDRLRASILAGITVTRPLAPLSAAPDGASADPARSTATSAAGSDELADVRDRRGRRTTRWFGAAAAMLALLAGTATIRAVDLGRQLDSLSTVASQVSSVLTSPDAITVTGPVASGGRAAVVQSDSLGKAVLVTDGFPPPPTGRTYQVWYLGADGSATSAGFVPDTATGALLLTGDPRGASGVGITLEPAGGSPQPTTTPVLAVSL